MESDLRTCQDIFRRHSRTYYYSSQCFPAARRRHVYVLYAFFRTPDEYVDNPVADPETEMARFRAEHDAAWETGRTHNPVLRAFLETARLHGIPKAWADAFLDAMAMDLTISRYETYADLRRYVYGSAEVVGLMMARVLGVPADGLPAARELGLAMQLTNFYRDIGEDWQRGRIYVPREDLERFGIAERDWSGRVDPVRFGALMRFQAARNRRQYRVAHLGFPYIPHQSRLAVALSSIGYQRTLHCVMRDPMMVWRTRVSYRRADYPSILYRAWNAAYAH